MEYNEIAAKWWADRLRNVGIHNYLDEEGDDITQDGKGMFMGVVTTIKMPPSDYEAIKRFEEVLAEVIREQVERDGTMILTADDGPDHILAEAGKKANVTTMFWLFDTKMWITSSNVKVRWGHEAPEETIFLSSN